MPLRKLTLIIIVLTSLALAGALYIVSSVIISRSFSDLENSHVIKNVDRVLDAIAYDASSLNLKAADWAERDDTYVFVEDVNEHYIKENLTDETFQILRANILVFLDREKRVKYKQAFDLADSKPVDFEQEELAEILEIPGLTSHENEKSLIAGIVLLSRGPMLVA
ncbi:MAG: CHASE4 domain-containing protein, partial [Desulfomonilaceae bacterium]